MSEAAPTTTRLEGWNTGLETALCERCQRRFLLPQGLIGQPGISGQDCPHCRQPALALLPQGLAEMPYPAAPELAAPFALAPAALDQAARQFARAIPYPPEDLTTDHLRARLARVYLPMWLADAWVEADWQGEAGFDYQVISHQEQYDQNRGQWVSKQVKEGRVRWEPRIGRVRRAYQNVAVSALEDSQQLQKALGPFDLRAAGPYEPGCLEQAAVRLPDLAPRQAWSEAAPAFQQAAAEDCRQACGADHQRQFRWKAQFSQLHWTLLLLPAYTTYYLDDQGRPQPLLIHGQTGQVSGPRRASTRRAGQTSLALLLAGIIFFLIGLILEAFAADPLLGLISTAALLLGLGAALGSTIPYLTAWDFNRKNQA